MKIKQVTREHFAIGLKEQFRFMFDLSEENAQKATDEALKDEELVQASILGGNRTAALAMKFGWKPPASALEPEEPT